MLKQFLLIVTAGISLSCFGQSKTLILKGKLDNCPEKELYIAFYNNPAQPIKDTIHINETGDFYFKTLKCEKPQKISIQHNSTQIDGLLVAPGYELTISGDAKERQMLMQVTLSGIGACVNSYKKKLEELAFEGKDIPVVYEIDTTLTNTINYRDSLLNAVFDNCTDPYAADFKKLERYETSFSNYSSILNRANSGNYDNNTYFSFINKNIPDTILAHPGKAEWLVSNKYRTSFIPAYKNYLLQLANRKDSNIIKNDKDYILKRVSNIFNDEVREYILSTAYSSAIDFSQSLEELEKIQRKYEPFIDSNITPSQKMILEEKFAKKYSFFETTGKGMSAPGFSLPDPQNLKHSLSDYLGKVIYIDFWASWCSPCRAESPSLKKLYTRYKSNKNFKIIGVAVSDGRDNWLKAIMEDETAWLQLRDENGKTDKNYNANLIPMFVIIDKKGKIVTMDAPRPSEGKKLFKIIDKELLK